MEKSAKVVVFGASGLIGNALIAALRGNGYKNIVPCLHSEVDLVNQAQVQAFFEKVRPEYIFFCAHRNVSDFHTGEIIDAAESYANIMMLCNVMEAAKNQKVKKAIFVGSAMLYPWDQTDGAEPMREERLQEYFYLGYSESMRSTVLSKFVGLKLCQYYYLQYGCPFVYALPTHIYGSLLNRRSLYLLERIVVDITEAKKQGSPEIHLDIYGKGVARKQFLHVSDCADALITVMEKYAEFECPINISTPQATCWSEIVKTVCGITGYNGKVKFDSTHSENMANRLVSVERLQALGWEQKIGMRQGMTQICKEYLERLT
ncbi:NAD-dependent epimerase/dehydratase family protein [Acutalibacter intestini]|uniref:NAD-dependent epimerase/dehydratase family protein n=1 Tax=Acutalibacter intestini TaxID=3093659 RepID=UPI002AC961AA|nr:NAD-dependent epimerase/dehydratase family protein [Acutalibacter sp. M00204]